VPCALTFCHSHHSYSSSHLRHVESRNFTWRHLRHFDNCNFQDRVRDLNLLAFLEPATNARLPLGYGLHRLGFESQHEKQCFASAKLAECEVSHSPASSAECCSQCRVLLLVPSAALLPFPLPAFVACRATTLRLCLRHTNFDNRISHSISLSVLTLCFFCALFLRVCL
jgi:hypothetical protein